MHGAAGEARRRGYHVRHRAAGRRLMPEVRPARIFAQSAILWRAPRAASCVVSSGKRPSVSSDRAAAAVTRNLLWLQPRSLAAIGGAVVASVGTDGIDGPTDAAGAIVDSQTFRLAPKAKALRHHVSSRDSNSMRFSKRFVTLFRTGADRNQRRRPSDCAFSLTISDVFSRPDSFTACASACIIQPALANSFNSLRIPKEERASIQTSSESACRLGRATRPDSGPALPGFRRRWTCTSAGSRPIPGVWLRRSMNAASTEGDIYIAPRT